MKRPNTGVAFLEQIEAILDNALIYELAELVPAPPPENGGRPRDMPNWAYFFYVALITVFGSSRRVETEMAWLWGHIQERVRSRFPNDPGMWLPDKPMRRHHWDYLRSRYLVDTQTWTELKATFVRRAAAQAESIGLCGDDGGGSLTHPERARMLYADGKVLKPLYRAKRGDRRVDRATGEVKSMLADPDAELHITGSGEPAYGNKYGIVAVRSNAVHGRVILNFDHVPEPGGEAHVSLDCLAEIAPLLPGAQGVLYDGAFRGVHLQRLLHELGLLPVVPVQAATGGRRKRQERTERTVAVERRELPNGTTTEFFARAGQIGIQELDERGEQVFVPLERRKVDKRRNADGTWRWYQVYGVASELGGGTLRVRLDTTDDDRQRKFNRTEHLRAIPPADPDYRRLYPRRSDIESINRALDDTMWLRRAHSVGARRQLVDLLGFAIRVNSIALYRTRYPNEPPIEVAA